MGKRGIRSNYLTVEVSEAVLYQQEQEIQSQHYGGVRRGIQIQSIKQIAHSISTT